MATRSTTAKTTKSATRKATLPDDVVMNSGRGSRSRGYLTTRQITGALDFTDKSNYISSWGDLVEAIRSQAPQVFTYTINAKDDSAEQMLSINVPVGAYARVTDQNSSEFTAITNWAVEMKILRLGFTADGKYTVKSVDRQLGGAKQLVAGNTRQNVPTWTSMDYVLRQVSDNLSIDHESLSEFIESQLQQLDVSSLALRPTTGLAASDLQQFTQLV